MTEHRDEANRHSKQAQQSLDRCFVELTTIREELAAAGVDPNELAALLEAMGLVAIAVETVSPDGKA